MTLNLVIEYFDGVFLVLLVVFVFLQQFIISRVNRTLSPDQRFPRFRKGILPLIYVPSVVHPRSAIAGDYHTLYPRTRFVTSESCAGVSDALRDGRLLVPNGTANLDAALS